MDIQNLIQLNIEIEGLLRVVASRDSDDTKQLLLAKFEDFKSLFEQHFKPIVTEVNVLANDNLQSATSVEVPQVDQEISLEPETEEHSDMISENSSDVECNNALAIESPILDSVQNLESSTETVVISTESEESKAEQENVELLANKDRDAETLVEEIAASRPNEMRVDEMLMRREARDLRKAFTLNDKFRFRRELFANNDAQFADTLNLLSAMKNMEEAVEYMRDDLGWDMDSDEVKDFVNIISNHFE